MYTVRSGAIILICIPLIIGNTYAQPAETISARNIALSGADISSWYSGYWMINPAALARCNIHSVTISYYDRYMLPELGECRLSGTYYTQHGTFLPAVSYLGQKYLNYSSLAVSYGLEIAPWAGVGIKMQYCRVAIESIHRNTSSISGDAGIIVNPFQRLFVGIVAINPAGRLYQHSNPGLAPTSLQVGISYAENQQYCMAAKLCWDEFKELNYALGAEYRLCNSFTVRAGVRFPDRLCYSYGVGLNLTNIRIDLGFDQHQVLGISSSFTLTYNIH